jgi:hypothetical protein
MVVKDKEDYLKQYKVDEVYYIEDLETYFKRKNPKTIFLYDGQDSYSGLKPRVPILHFFDQFKLDRESLYHIL